MCVSSLYELCARKNDSGKKDYSSKISLSPQIFGGQKKGWAFPASGKKIQKFVFLKKSTFSSSCKYRKILGERKIC